MKFSGPNEYITSGNNPQTSPKHSHLVYCMRVFVSACIHTQHPWACYFTSGVFLQEWGVWLRHQIERDYRFCVFT